MYFIEYLKLIKLNILYIVIVYPVFDLITYRFGIILTLFVHRPLINKLLLIQYRMLTVTQKDHDFMSSLNKIKRHFFFTLYKNVRY